LVTPTSAGTYYIWAAQTATPGVYAVSAAVTVSAAVSGSVTLTNPPTAGNAGVALSLAGTVSPSGTAVQVGLSTSPTAAPTTWTNATISGTAWTASLTPASAGTYYVWAEETNNTGVQAVSAAVIVAASGGSGSPLTYSLISGSGSGAMSSVTMTNATSTPPVNWTSSIAPSATNVQPNVKLSSTSGIGSGLFWFDTSATNVTPPSSGFGYVASLNNSEATFYANSSGFGTPIAAPASPATAGTYYGKYAFYSGGSLDASTGGTLLGVYVTSAITIT